MANHQDTILLNRRNYSITFTDCSTKAELNMTPTNLLVKVTDQEGKTVGEVEVIGRSIINR